MDRGDFVSDEPGVDGFDASNSAVLYFSVDGYALANAVAVGIHLPRMILAGKNSLVL